MNRCIQVIITVLLFVSVMGCQSYRQGQKITIEGDGKFPQFLVGKWKAHWQSGWEFNFESDGAISSAVVELGRVRMVPGTISRFETKGGGEGIYEPGMWTVKYDPATSVLAVYVDIEHFYQDLGPSALEGAKTDYLVGPVSEKDLTWTVDWYSTERFIAHTDEVVEFSNVQEPEFRHRFILRKVVSEE